MAARNQNTQTHTDMCLYTHYAYIHIYMILNTMIQQLL